MSNLYKRVDYSGDVPIPAYVRHPFMYGRSPWHNTHATADGQHVIDTTLRKLLGISSLPARIVLAQLSVSHLLIMGDREPPMQEPLLVTPVDEFDNLLDGHILLDLQMRTIHPTPEGLLEQQVVPPRLEGRVQELPDGSSQSQLRFVKPPHQP